MTSLSSSTNTDDKCEHCHSGYTILKRKKTCAVCHQSYCGNCAPREQHASHSYRLCLICRLISNESTTSEQLRDLKVKQLRYYLQAKNIPNQTCTEKQELIDLVEHSRHLPFPHLSTPQIQTSSSPVPPPQMSSNNHHSGPFTNLQHTVSSFANQMNHFASNIQDYVSNTVTDALNQSPNDRPQQPPPTSNNSASSRPTTTNTAPHPSQQEQRRPTATATATTTANQRGRRKSLSEIRNEENIEDLNIRELKDILAANFVDFKGCVEKSELLEKVRRLYRDRQTEKIKEKQADSSTANDHELCKICMDAIADCVFLDCGHMVTCVKCGKLLAECPICRSNIVRVVRVFKS